MIIATTQDLAEVACCPCGYPVTESPQKECQSLRGFGDLAWSIYNGVSNTFYQTSRVDWSDGGFRQRSWSEPWNAWFEGYPTTPGAAVSISVETITEGDPRTGIITPTYLDPVDIGAALAAALSALEGAAAWDNEDYTYGSDCATWRENNTPGFIVDGVIEVVLARYRFGVPPDYTRSTYELQWDEGFFPQEWIDWKALKDVYDAAFTSHQEWEACELLTPGDCGGEPYVPTDPGTPPSPAPSLIASQSWIYDGATEFSDWFTTPTPEGDGEVRIVNVMALGWKSSRTGQKPTSHGEIHAFA